MPALEPEKLRRRAYRVPLVSHGLECEIAWETDGPFLSAPPLLTLSPQGAHTLKTSVLLVPKDLRALAKMIVEAADAYDACRDAEERHIDQLKAHT